MRTAVLLPLFLVFTGGCASAEKRVGPPADLHVQANDLRLARGEYLAEHVTVCVECHSERDWSKWAGPVVPGTEGMGGPIFPDGAGPSGTLLAANITPSGISDWTDGEIARSITSGLDRDGNVTFPIMPYPAYNHLAEEDLYAIIAYIRTLTPIENHVPDGKFKKRMNVIAGAIPQPYTPSVAPSPTDELAYGEYLTAIAGCEDCHSPMSVGGSGDKRAWGGGRVFKGPKGRVLSANISSDKKTGIGRWPREAFVARFKGMSSEAAKDIPLADGMVNTPMPWLNYAGMTSADLGAIHTYLMSQPPVDNAVVRYPDLH